MLKKLIISLLSCFIFLLWIFQNSIASYWSSKSQREYPLIFLENNPLWKLGSQVNQAGYALKAKLAEGIRSLGTVVTNFYQVRILGLPEEDVFNVVSTPKLQYHCLFPGDVEQLRQQYQNLQRLSHGKGTSIAAPKVGNNAGFNPATQPLLEHQGQWYVNLSPLIVGHFEDFDSTTKTNGGQAAVQVGNNGLRLVTFASLKQVSASSAAKASSVRLAAANSTTANSATKNPPTNNPQHQAPVANQATGVMNADGELVATVQTAHGLVQVSPVGFVLPENTFFCDASGNKLEPSSSAYPDIASWLEPMPQVASGPQEPEKPVVSFPTPGVAIAKDVVDVIAGGHDYSVYGWQPPAVDNGKVTNAEYYYTYPQIPKLANGTELPFQYAATNQKTTVYLDPEVAKAQAEKLAQEQAAYAQAQAAAQAEAQGQDTGSQANAQATVQASAPTSQPAGTAATAASQTAGVPALPPAPTPVDLSAFNLTQQDPAKQTYPLKSYPEIDLKKIPANVTMVTEADGTIRPIPYPTVYTHPARRVILHPKDEVLIAGDSMQQGVGRHIRSLLSKHYGIFSRDLSKQNTGLISPHNLDWNKTIRDELSKPRNNYKLVVMLLGANDNYGLSDRSRSYGFGTEQWKAHYLQRIMAVMYEAHSRGIEVIWIAPPNVQRKDLAPKITLVRELFEQAAKQYGVILIDANTAIGQKQDEYSGQMELEGRVRVTRTKDTIHFTRVGELQIANAVFSNISFYNPENRPVMDEKLTEDDIVDPKSGSHSKPTTAPTIPTHAPGQAVPAQPAAPASPAQPAQATAQPQAAVLGQALDQAAAVQAATTTATATHAAAAAEKVAQKTLDPAAKKVEKTVDQAAAKTATAKKAEDKKASPAKAETVAKSSDKQLAEKKAAEKKAAEKKAAEEKAKAEAAKKAKAKAEAAKKKAEAEKKAKENQILNNIQIGR